MHVVKRPHGLIQLEIILPAQVFGGHMKKEIIGCYYPVQTAAPWIPMGRVGAQLLNLPSIVENNVFFG